MKAKFLCLGLILWIANIGLCGIYGLIVCDHPEPTNKCFSTLPKGLVGTESFPVRSATEIAQDIERYFSGQKPKLDLFYAAFQNARICFCSNQERSEIYTALIAALKKDHVSNEQDAYDYFFMLGSQSLVTMLDSELAQPGLYSTQKHRLETAREKVMQGIKARQR